MKFALTRCFLLLLAIACVAVFLLPHEAAEARGKNKSRDVVQSYFEGVDADGNDTFGTKIHAGKKNRRMKNYLARHQTAEEGVYGPGDQSTVWDRQLEKRMNPRSDAVRSGRRGSLGRQGGGVSYSESGYDYREYSNDCSGS
ncbi:MAG: hypothetical protein ACK5Q5_22455 [Planctomycetaceae bacterium]